MIVTVTNLKGGTGKTTTSILLATALDNLGYDCEVIDADPQGSATDWAALAADIGEPLPFDVRVENASSLKRFRQRAKITIIDCPPGNAAIVDMAITFADHCIIPVSPSALDVDRMWDTLQTVEGKAPATVLLTSARLGTTNLDELREILQSENIPTFKAPILQREAVRRLYGTRPTRFHGYNGVAQEVIALEKEID